MKPELVLSEDGIKERLKYSKSLKQYLKQMVNGFDTDTESTDTESTDTESTDTESADTESTYVLSDDSGHEQQ